MSGRHDTAATLPWMREGTAHLLAVVEKRTDTELARPTALPGWTGAHVVGHVARNAEALIRLATWARTGVETPMYADAAQRATEIEHSAGLPPATLRSDLAETAERLDTALDALTPDQWRVQVRSALGRAIPAAEVPWMRIREVWLHAVDLGASVEDLPPGVVDLVLDDAGAALSAKDDCPGVVLTPTDRDRTWTLGAPDAADQAAAVHAPAADLAGWLTGRVPAPDRPALPRWL
ncbi:maleylpyruvate isomerase family mycothiol-dependent enzyme [Amycolatopsis sp. FDAARGOS 1241]|uniref:maleylpyruvate isomerase family mycothiol-dependent enzyme n=1 Tax=Amycolatopsis sp. FDAARGOS 1241 TaxID=2778070 RepID=UPI001950FAA7|nr:maleylpyruvate isomerase family mycothiol-dependent enzyme [Amycolatopsis sp. FDAARGOS 1241]QRP43040.1 maleylpyruvate isomerase family mycothiol-dependent enzyme [Amycolatopsis sp. FDAARGOS 1241]